MTHLHMPPHIQVGPRSSSSRAGRPARPAATYTVTCLCIRASAYMCICIHVHLHIRASAYAFICAHVHLHIRMHPSHPLEALALLGPPPTSHRPQRVDWHLVPLLYACMHGTHVCMHVRMHPSMHVARLYACLPACMYACTCPWRARDSCCSTKVSNQGL